MSSEYEVRDLSDDPMVNALLNIAAEVRELRRAVNAGRMDIEDVMHAIIAVNEKGIPQIVSALYELEEATRA